MKNLLKSLERLRFRYTESGGSPRVSTGGWFRLISLPLLTRGLPVWLFLVVISTFTGCNNGSATGNKTSAPEAANANSEDKSKVKYPPVAASIMQAENKMLDDSVMKLEDKKGKVLLVNLWATWCGPCRREMPHLNEMQEKYRAKGLEIIGLDVDPESKQQVEDFAKEMKLNYTLGWANERLTIDIMKLNKMDGIPQTILINRNGELTGIFRGGSDSVIGKMKETVEKIVNE